MGKKYTATIEFFDPQPSANPEEDVEVMLKYGWKHQTHSTNVVGPILTEDYVSEDDEDE